MGYIGHQKNSSCIFYFDMIYTELFKCIAELSNIPGLFNALNITYDEPFILGHYILRSKIHKQFNLIILGINVLAITKF